MENQTGMQGLETFWKVLLVIVTGVNAISAAGYIIGRWTKSQEAESGAHGVELDRLEKDVAALREWRHAKQNEETGEMAKLYRDFVPQREFGVYKDATDKELKRIWDELGRLRNGRHNT